MISIRLMLTIRAETKMPCDHESDLIANIDGLFSYALMLTRNCAEAEGLVQETFVRAVPAVDRLRAGSNLKAWLFTILRDVWRKRSRKRRSESQFSQIDD